MFSTDLSYYYPCISAITYFFIVFAIAELARKILDKTVRHSSSFYVFAIELIGTAQMCTCVYENGIMIKYYGVSAFFFTVASLLTAGNFMNRGAFVSPLGPIEACYFGLMSPYRLLTLLLAETIGGFCAFRFARSLWYQTLQYSEAHRDSYINDACTLNYKVAFPLVIAFEIVGCFLIRLIVPNLPRKINTYAVPAVIAGFLTFAFVYIGVPGLNPVVASSRMFGCSGIDAQWFIALYWICPVIGWLAAATLQKSMVKKVPKKKKTN